MQKKPYHKPELHRLYTHRELLTFGGCVAALVAAAVYTLCYGLFGA